METKCLCLWGGECRLTDNELESLSKQHGKVETQFITRALFPLNLISPRFGATSRNNRQLVSWLQKTAAKVNAQHVILRGYRQSGANLDEMVARDATFVL